MEWCAIAFIVGIFLGCFLSVSYGLTPRAPDYVDSAVQEIVHSEVQKKRESLYWENLQDDLMAFRRA